MASTIPERRRRFPPLRWALLVLISLLAACSSTTFMYNRLDFLVPWYVDDYVELDDEQEAYLDELLDPFLAWHRREELPRYVALLDQADAVLDQPLTRAELERLTREMELAGDRVQTRSLDWMLLVGERLRAEQLDEFIANLQDKQEELEEKYLDRDLEEYREDALDRLADNASDYLGRLSAEQKAALEASVEKLQRSDRLWLEERAVWVGRLQTLLQREAGWQAQIREEVAGRWENSSEDYRAMYAGNIAVIQGALVDLINSRTERQDRHLRRKLANLREDFVALNSEAREVLEAASPAAP